MTGIHLPTQIERDVHLTVAATQPQILAALAFLAFLAVVFSRQSACKHYGAVAVNT
jgi:hypothetical protein